MIIFGIISVIIGLVGISRAIFQSDEQLKINIENPPVTVNPIFTRIILGVFSFSVAACGTYTLLNA